MAKDKLHNLLDFNQFDIQTANPKQKGTKRTETGLDIIQEHHLDDVDDRKEFIIDNLDKLDDEWIEIIYMEIENILNDEDIESEDDIIDDNEGEIEDDTLINEEEPIEDENIESEEDDDETIKKIGDFKENED